MILIVGSTGLLGSEICRQLRARGHQVRGLVRDGSPREVELRQLGVEVALGDLKNPASLRSACRGVSSVLTTANSILSRRRGDSLKTVDRDGSLALVNAARAEGVSRFVYTSVTPALSSWSPFVRYKRQIEDAVRRSGMAWTILQPSAFMQTHLGRTTGWNLEAGEAVMVGDGSVPSRYIDVGDVARFAVLALECPELAGSEMPLAGPQALSPRQALRHFEEVAGRSFRVKRIPLGMVRAMAVTLAPINPVLSSVMKMACEMTTLTDRTDMERLIGRLPEPVHLTSVRDYVERQWAELRRG